MTLGYRFRTSIVIKTIFAPLSPIHKVEIYAKLVKQVIHNLSYTNLPSILFTVFMPLSRVNANTTLIFVVEKSMYFFSET